MSTDQSRPVATRPDSDFTLSIDEALERYSKAGHPRTPRSVQRYCAKGHLQCRLVETAFGEKYLIAPDSVDKHIAYIEEVTPTTGRDLSRQDVTSRDNVAVEIPTPKVPTTGGDMSRHVATSPDLSPLVEQLRSEVQFLRGEIAVKNDQIREQTERARETNVLIGGLQKMLTPLLNKGSDTQAQ
ncbi:hypothetical protein [Rhodoplanes sp. Z2-YC6860]|uniref:hypothetical protein n=1 Tax=Rhodoplanes sp. Z2-YC6860 TaxID=674703 RepID=UPI00078C962C|nr:hypothetical protein [Rhodoplanes sp. Z2-YC6860]AMN44721.1 hypothetical protein RHPLAN_63120 [Rhodoplanes sp. Z2-YC6860]